MRPPSEQHPANRNRVAPRAVMFARPAGVDAVARRARGPGVGVLALFSITLFVSAGLLFLVQPMVGRMALPRLGGTPAVWNTCLLFFQVGLLLGYLYSHLTPRWLGLRGQAAVHLVLLLAPALCLPVAFRAGWTPPAGQPVLWLLACLTASVALPFFVVSTTGSLLQRWFTATGHRAAVDPYFLYAASNAGSLLALLAYPLAIEPWLTLRHQSVLWSVGYGVLVVLIAACAACLFHYAPPSRSHARSGYAAHARPTWQRRARWVVLAAVPSSWLMGVTTFLTGDVAAVPLLWIIPLALYLLTFVLCFLKQPPVSHTLMVRLLTALVLGVVLLRTVHAVQPVWLVLSVHIATFFVGAMVCHGELARQRPAAEHLSDYYLMMSIGGALGGAFNALLAPVIFAGPFEYPVALVAGCLLVPAREVVRSRAADRATSAWAVLADLLLPMGVTIFIILVPFALVWLKVDGRPGAAVLAVSPALLACVAFRRRRWRFALAVGGLLAVATLGAPRGGRIVDVRRSFFGVHRVIFSSAGFVDLYHGTTLHGRERADPATRQPTGATRPTTYYHRSGPVGDVMAAAASVAPGGAGAAAADDADDGPRVAVVGLGAGSIAAYARPGWDFTFYEIDPTVVWAAERSGHFDYVPAARARGATVRIVLGDARLTLRDAPAAQYDLIVLDAFSGDSIPVHLLTREAIATYVDKLAPNGMLVVHTSNVYLDLPPVLAAAARDAHLAMALRDDAGITPAQAADGKVESQWVLLAREQATVDRVNGWSPFTGRPTRLWTDDYSNVLGTLRWRPR